MYDTSIILAEDTYRLVRHAIEGRELNVVTVVGKSEPIRIYELLAEAGGLDITGVELRDTFAQGLDAYRQQNWETATAQFEICRRLAPDDGPSRVYLERIAHLRCNPPPPDWDGVWRLAEK